MANYRQIHTQIWRDDWFSELTTDEKLLFIYLFSNDSSSLTGLYKISLRVIAFETGLEIEYIKDALAKFEQAKRAIYRDGICWVVHMWRYHSNASPKVQTRIQNDLKLIPDTPIKKAYIHYQHTNVFDADTISILDEYLIGVSDLNLTELKVEETTTTTDAVKLWLNNIGYVNPILAEKIADWEREFTPHWVCEAITEAVGSSQGTPTPNYIDAILKRWKAEGFKAKRNGNNAPRKKGDKYTGLSEEERRHKYAEWEQTRTE